MVAEIAADRDDPAVLGLKQDRAVAPVRSAAGDHDRQLAAEIGRTPPINARGVSDADLDLLFLGARVAKTFKPRRARRSAPAGIDHEVRRNGFFGGVFELDANAANCRMRSICNQPLHRALRSEEHTSELQSRLHLVCRLLLEKKK